MFFLTEKRNGDIKARKVARGDKQHTFNGYVKFNTSLQTVLTDGVIKTRAIDVHEGSDVAIMDIPGAFLNTKTMSLQ